MDVRALATTALTPAGSQLPAVAPEHRPEDGIRAFGEVLATAIDALQQRQTAADTLAGALAAGQDIDLHEVMLALEEANLTTQLAVQVRNKLVEAYQEVSRMQV